jgi:hypothetical protein
VVKLAEHERRCENVKLDLKSFQEIVGDYRATIQECYALLRNNRSYMRSGSGVPQLKWQLCVQNDVNRLTECIKTFNSKLIFLLEPLKIDLLSRISNKVDDIHNVVVKGKSVLEYGSKNRRKEEQQLHLFEIPADWDTIFHQQADIDKPEFEEETAFPLAEGAEALVLHLTNSTRSFIPRETLAESRRPPVKQYINLLKCIWLLRKLWQHPELQDPRRDSHWPSYIDKLANEVSSQCKRFLPDGSGELLRPEDLDCPVPIRRIWPPMIPKDLNDNIRPEPAEMMDELMNVEMKSRKPNTMQLMRVYRGPKGRMKLIFSTTERRGNQEPRTEHARFEFNIKGVALLPLYAMPTGDDHGLKIQLVTDSGAEADLFFSTLEDALQFQQAVTGFKPFGWYSRSIVDVALILSEGPEWRKACVQLWIPRELKGKPASMESIQAETQPSTVPHKAWFSSLWKKSPDSRTPSSVDTFGKDIKYGSKTPARTSTYSIPSSPLSPTSTRNGYPFPSSPPRRENSKSTLQPNQRCNVPDSSASNHRVSVGKSSDSSSSVKTTSRQTVTVVDHGNGHGFLHTKPRKPMLVLFIYDKSKLKNRVGLSFVTVQIDDNTAINPIRCECYVEYGRECPDAAIERAGGEKLLLAQLYEAEELSQWDVTLLGVEKRKELPGDMLADLTRVSIRFAQPGNPVGPVKREEFGGFNCGCRVETVGGLNSCLEQKHGGLFGKVKETGRRALMEWNEMQNSHRDIVVIEPRAEEWRR